MRTLMFVVTILISASAASAQQASSIMDFSQKPVAVKTLIEAIAEETLVIYDTEIPDRQWNQSLNVEGTDTLPGKLRAINLVIRTSGLEAKEASGGRIIIMKSTSPRAVDQMETYPAPPVYTPPPQSAGRIGGSMMRRLAMESQEPQSTYSGVGVGRFGNGHWDTRYGRQIWVPAWWLEQQRAFANRGDNGGLKANGDTKGVLLYARGCFVANAEEVDSPHNQKAAIPSGDYITITAVRIKDWRAYDVPVRPASEALNNVVGARHLTTRIDKRLFEGRSSYEFDHLKAAADCEAAAR